MTKPGGRIVVRDGDVENAVLDAPDVETTRVVHTGWANALRHGRMGRQLFGLFKQAGLTEVTVEPVTVMAFDLDTVMSRFRYGDVITRLLEDGMLEAERVAAWRDSLVRASQEGRFFWATTSFIVAGRRL